MTRIKRLVRIVACCAKHVIEEPRARLNCALSVWLRTPHDHMTNLIGEVEVRISVITFSRDLHAQR